MDSDDTPHSFGSGMVTSPTYSTGESQLDPSDSALNLLMVAAHGQNQVNSTLQKASTGSSMDNFIGLDDYGFSASTHSQVSKQGLSECSPTAVRLPVIRSSNDMLVDDYSASNEEDWCNKCCCSVPRNEVKCKL